VTVAADAHKKAKATLAKRVGITMAVLGVLLAVCAALVGTERTDVVRTLVLQSNAWDEYQSESAKHRLMTSELVMLDALTPTKTEARAFESEMAKIRAGAHAGRGDNPEVMEALDTSSRELTDVLSPDHDDGLHFAHIIHGYEEERAAAARWAEAYDASIDAHFQAGERFDRVQLVAEIGVVVASLGLLLSSRALWAAALAAAVVCGGATATVAWVSSRSVRAAEARVAAAETAYRDLRERLEAKGEDSAVIRRVQAHEETRGFGAP
jgi:hypothetical protein